MALTNVGNVLFYRSVIYEEFPNNFQDVSWKEFATNLRENNCSDVTLPVI